MSSSYQLSIVVPARSEEFLGKTVEDLLQNKRGDTEIIVGCDGNWPHSPMPIHPDVTVLYYPKSIGQRAIMNRCVKLSRAKYVLKTDAHCTFDQGFDVKMMKEMQDDWTMVPIMKNLHAFDWVCAFCGFRQYQGPKPEKCPECAGVDFEKDVIWFAKPSPNSTSYRFNKELHFKYFGRYKARQIGDIVDTMSLQGSCFMCAREKYWELELCDEGWGSWGQQGVEVSVKTQLAGGRVVCNKTTWYAHMFRTQKGFRWPYPAPGRSQRRARKITGDIFPNNKWEKQIYPFSWLLEKYWPIPDWEEKDLAEQKEREMKSERPGIYRIKCRGNNKVYIGSAKSFAQRFNEHLRRLRRKDHENKHLQRSWDKYGEDNFEFGILRFCSLKDLLLHEQKYIDEYKEKLGWRNMFNMNPSASSGLGRPHAEEAKAKMSAKQSGVNNGFYGKKHTEESIEKMREAHKGQEPWNKGVPHSEETKRKISEANTGKEAWNKGLTKETDERIRKCAEETAGKPKWENKEHPRGMLGKKHSEETKRKIGAKSAEIAKNRERDSNGKFKPKPKRRKKPPKGVVYYTDNRIDEKIMAACQKQITKGIKEKHVISVSLEPIEFGKNIHIPLKRGYLTMFKQILAGLEASTADVIFFCEHDVLYHRSHFDFIPPKKDAFYYNLNVWKVRIEDGHALRVDDCKQTSGLCAWRELLLEHYRKRVEVVEKDGYTRYMGFEPGTRSPLEGMDGHKAESWMSECPNIDIRHEHNLTPNRWCKEEFRNQKYTIGWTEADEAPGWGVTRGRFSEVLDAIIQD